ncbi:hypothetical protein EGW08_006800, partial [Elysia chlorotica]
FRPLVYVNFITSVDNLHLINTLYPIPVCQLPSRTGRCRAAIRRYFYDTATGVCQPFTYGGCDGNANNFATISECRAVCTCSEPLDSGYLVCNARARRRYYYNSETGTCSRFRYSGCGGNSNSFRSASQCQSACATAKCYLPAETGLCKAFFPRYYFDSQSGTCEMFGWGGCGGNSNNFQSKETCVIECASRVATPAPSEIVTLVTASPGNGGGGNGGENSGGSGKSREMPSECLLPKIIGRCRAAFPRFFYNDSTGSCERFLYGGCGGNANNFRTVSACESRCPSRVKQSIPSPSWNICKLPKKHGSCLEGIKSYAFNWSSGRCTQFYYGGCHGNENRFPDRNTCMETCIP